jgi:iron complex outermembrane receptor protein
MLRVGAYRFGLIGALSYWLLVAQVAADVPQPGAAREVRIPAGPLVAALEALQKQANLELVYRADQLSSYRTSGVNGTYTPQEAVHILLRGTPLQVRMDASGAMIIVLPEPAPRKERIGAVVPPASESPAAPVAALEEIVVTAQKRAENIISVPASVAYVTAETLESQHATQLQDYAANVAGLQVDSQGTPGQTTITLRGIAPLGSGSAVGTYINDAPVGSSSLYSFSNSFQLDLLPYDLKGIEVLRGPQGTLYGASTMGGLVKYVLRSPDTENFHLALGGDVFGIHSGSEVGGGLRGSINIPLIQDVLAVRASGFHESTPGFVDDPARNERNINAVRQDGGRLALGWSPTSNLQISLEAFFQRTTADGDATVALDPTGNHTVLGDLTTNLLVSQPFQQTTEFAKSSLEWTLPVCTLSSVASYSDTRNRQVQDASATFVTLFPLVTGAPGVAPQFIDVRLHKYTEELRLASSADQPIQWMLGGFATYEEVSNEQGVAGLGLDFQPNALNPILLASIPTRYREEAAFANLTVPVVGGLSIGPGIRFSHNSQDFTLITGGLLSPGPPESGVSSQNVVTYSVNTKYEFSPQAMTYVRVASGYQPGGPNVALQGVPPTVEASTITNYEVGYKAQMLSDRLMLDVALFRMNWKKIQTTAVTQTGIQYLTNGGGARSQGLEAAATFRPTRALSFGTSLAFTDAIFSTGIASLGTVPGQRLPAVPRISASFAPQYELGLPGGWEGQIGASMRFVGSRPVYLFVAPAPPVTFAEKSYFSLDLNARAHHGDWRVGVFAKNILDRRAYLTKSAIPDAVTGDVVQVNSSLLQPRTIGLSIDRVF